MCKSYFWENKPFSPFVEYHLGYAFALNSLTATHWEPESQKTIYYERRHQGRYSYLGIGVTHKHSSLSFGILGQDGHQNGNRAGYMGGYPIELRYSCRFGK